MNLLHKLDQFIITQAEKRKDKPPSFGDKIFRNQYVLIIASILIIYRTVDHALHSFEEHHRLLGIMYSFLVLVLVVANIRHHFFQLKIEFLEQAIMFLEAALVLWYGLLRLFELNEQEASLGKILAFAISVLLLVCFYLLVSRNWYLIRIGKVKNPYHH